MTSEPQSRTDIADVLADNAAVNAESMETTVNTPVCKEAVIEGAIVKSGPFVTEHEARMALANEVEEVGGGRVCPKRVDVDMDSWL